jgi:hypothetical protein
MRRHKAIEAARQRKPRDRSHEPARLKFCTGYRTDSKRHVAAAFKIPRAKRTARAKAGADARLAKLRRKP